MPARSSSDCVRPPCLLPQTAPSALLQPAECADSDHPRLLMPSSTVRPAVEYWPGTNSSQALKGGQCEKLCRRQWR
jgi:hypothetical protein